MLTEYIPIQEHLYTIKTNQKSSFFFFFILNNILSLEKKYIKKFLGAFLGYLFLSSQHHLLVILSFKNHCWFCIFKPSYKFRKGFLTAVIHRNCIVTRQIFITLVAVKQYYWKYGFHKNGEC